MSGLAQTDWLSQVAAFATHQVAPVAGAWGPADRPGRDLLAPAALLGLTGIELPVAEGGLGLPFGAKARACEVLAAADFGFAMSVVNTHNVAAKLALCAASEVKARWLPDLLDGRISACTALTEPGAGSDFAAIRMTARRDGGDWILDGEKTWITNARHAGLAIVYAQCGELGDRDGIGAFVVDLKAPGAERFARESAFSQVGTGTGGFRLNRYRLDEANLLLEPGTAFRSILSEINGARVYVAAMCCGMVQAALEAATEYGAERQSFGRPLAGHQAWRMDLARCATQLAAARALVAQAIAGIETDSEAQLLSAQAKIHAVDVAQAQLPVLLHAMGAEGLAPERPFARHLAAAQIAALTDGSTEMLLERVAQLTRAGTVRATQSDRR